MPDRFRINRPVSDELLAYIQSHPRVVSATRQNVGTNAAHVFVILDGTYTEQQIKTQVSTMINNKRLELEYDNDSMGRPEYDFPS